MLPMLLRAAAQVAGRGDYQIELIMVLEMEPERALFEGKLQGMVISCYEDERPLQGLAGLLDWRFEGVISHCVRTGAITGKAGECAYLPITRMGRTYHLIFAGCGHRPSRKERGHWPAESFKAVQKNLSTLGLREIGVSRSDLGEASDDALARHFKGTPIWIVH